MSERKEEDGIGVVVATFVIHTINVKILISLLYLQVGVYVFKTFVMVLATVQFMVDYQRFSSYLPTVSNDLICYLSQIDVLN